MTLDQLKQLEQALQMAQEICHERFCDKHPLGQSEVCKTLLEGISLLDSQASKRRRAYESYSEDCQLAIDELEQRFASEDIELCSIEYARHREEVGAATMRSRCVEKVIRFKGAHKPSRNQDYEYGFYDALDQIEQELQLLPLEQGEKEKRWGII